MPIKWRGGIEGAGFQNAGALADSAVHGKRCVISGADVAGFHRSEDVALNGAWTTANAGLSKLDHNNVSGLHFSKSISGRVYALTGRGSGDLLRSNDLGKTWAPVSGVTITGDGSTNGVTGLRATGRAIADDGAHVWCAGYTDGVTAAGASVVRSADSGATFQRWGLSGRDIRSLTVDPQNGNYLYGAQEFSGSPGGMAPTATPVRKMTGNLSWFNARTYTTLMLDETLAADYIHGISVFMKWDQLTTDGVTFDWAPFDRVVAACALAGKPWAAMIIHGQSNGQGLPAYVTADLPDSEIIKIGTDEPTAVFWSSLANERAEAIREAFAARYGADPWFRMFRITSFYSGGGEPWMMGGSTGKEVWVSKWNINHSYMGETRMDFEGLKAAYELHDKYCWDRDAAIFPSYISLSHAVGDAFQDVVGGLPVSDPNRHPSQLRVAEYARGLYGDRVIYQTNGANAAEGASGYQWWLPPSVGPEGVVTPKGRIGAQPIGGVMSGAYTPFMTPDEFETMINGSLIPRRYSFCEVYGGDVRGAIAGTTTEGLAIRNTLITAKDRWVSGNPAGIIKVTNAKAAAGVAPVVVQITGQGAAQGSDIESARDVTAVVESGKTWLYFIGRIGTEYRLWKFNATDSTGLTDITGPLSVASKWTTIHAYRNTADTATTVWAGCWEPRKTLNRAEGVVVSRDGGATWIHDVTWTGVNTKLMSGKEWWRTNIPGQRGWAIDGGTYDCNVIRTDPSNRATVYAFGRGGVWRSNDDGVTWRPMMENLLVAMSHGSYPNADNPMQIASCNVDWGLLLTLDTFKDVLTQHKPTATGSNTANNCFGACFNSRGLVAGFGDRLDKTPATMGSVYSTLNPGAGSGATWVSQKWEDAFPTKFALPNTPRCLGVVDGLDASGARVLIAIAQGQKPGTAETNAGGIYRKVITPGTEAGGAWSKVGGATAFAGWGVPNAVEPPLYWHPGTPYVYAFDKQTGLWRSDNYGVNGSWVRLSGWTSPVQFTGFLAAVDHRTVFLSTSTALYRFDDAHTAAPGATGVPINLPPGLTRPGPVAWDSSRGGLLLSQRVGTSSVGLWLSATARTVAAGVAPDWVDISDETYRSTALYTQRLSVTTAGLILMDGWGNAVLAGENDDSTPVVGVNINETWETGAVGSTPTYPVTAFNSTGKARITDANPYEGSKQVEFWPAAQVGFVETPAFAAAENVLAVDIILDLVNLPTANQRIIATRAGGANAGGVTLTTTGALWLQDVNTTRDTGAPVLAAGGRYRIAAIFDANADVCQLKVWTGANLKEIAPTYDSGAKAFTSGAPAEALRIGAAASTTWTARVDSVLARADGDWPIRAEVGTVNDIWGMPAVISPPVVASGQWPSGAGDDATANIAHGGYGAWRIGGNAASRPVRYARIWADADLGNMQSIWMLDNYRAANWTGVLDIACGGPRDGHTWASAATGSMDGIWTNQFNRIKSAWWSNLIRVSLSMAHELNGTWYPWSLTSSNVAAFKTAWSRWWNAVQTNLVNAGYPVEVCLSWNSDNQVIPMATAEPNRAHYDMIGSDFYSMFPDLHSGNWESEKNRLKSDGSPRGIQAWFDYAQSIGKPICFPEWGPNPQVKTENPFFVEAMRNIFAANAPSTELALEAGKMCGDAYFNTWTQCRMYPTTAIPNTAAKYRSLKWGAV